MRHIVQDRVGGLFGRFVTLVSPAKTAEPIVMPFGLWARTSSRNHELDGDPDPPREGTIFRKGSPIVKYRDFLPVSCAETTEPIDLPFGLWTRVGRRKHNPNGKSIGSVE